MGFFKDFKDDFSEAVNDLVPGAEELDTEDTATDTLDEEIDVQSELSKLDGLLEQVTKRVDGTPEEAAPATAKQENTVEDTVTMETREVVNEPVREVAPAVNVTPNPVVAPSTPVDDETAVITAGMTIKGDIESTGSVDVKGGIEGNITCNGKLVVTGVVHGNSTSSEFFADAAKIEGEVLGGMDVHRHALSFVPEVSATCMVDERPEYWHCDGCGLSFSDPEGRNTIRLDEQVILHPGHLVKHVPAAEPTVQAAGNTEYWECSRCGLVFADAALSQEIEKADTVLPKLEESAPAVPMQPMPPAAQPGVLAPSNLLPKTGDDSALPVVIVGVIGAIAVVAGIVVKMRGKSK